MYGAHGVLHVNFKIGFFSLSITEFVPVLSK